MKPRVLEPGEIVQISPDFESNRAFAGCLVVVSETKQWGAQGYVQGVGESREKMGGRYYIRLNWEDMEPTGGTVEWMVNP